MSRATNPSAQFRAHPEPIRDFAAESLSIAQKRYYDQYPDADRSIDLWTVEEVTEEN